MSTTARGKESRRHAGAGLRPTLDPYKTALCSAIELRRLGKNPKRTHHGHRKNVRDYVERGFAMTEFRHVLMDYSAGNVQLKARMMTRLEAYKRNATLRGTGFAWALCSK